MPTTFDQPVDGDVTHVSQINQYATAVNALENGTPYWGGDSLGGTTAYTASVTPAPGNNTAGTIVNLRMNATNTGATTLAVNGHTALPVRSKGADLAGGELQINGVYTFICDATYWHLVGIGGSASTNASTAFSSGQIPLARGGTGADLSATGGSGQFLKQSSAGGTITVGTIASGDLPPLLQFRASQQNAISVLAGTDLLYNTPSVNTVGTFSASKTLTFSTAGWYWCQTGMYFSGGASSANILALVNGTVVDSRTNWVNIQFAINAGFLLYVAVGDALKFQGEYSGGNTTDNSKGFVSDLRIYGPIANL